MTDNEESTRRLLEFDRAETFEGGWPEGLLRVFLRKKVGLYDISNGVLVINTEYDRIDPIHPNSDRLFSVYKDKKCGVMDLVDGLVVPIGFDRVGWFHDDLIRVSKGAQHGIYSVNDNSLALPVEYDRVEMLTSTLFLVKNGTRWGTYCTESDEVTWKA